MSDPDLPPDLTPEQADAYRRGFDPPVVEPVETGEPPVVEPVETGDPPVVEPVETGPALEDTGTRSFEELLSRPRPAPYVADGPEGPAAPVDTGRHAGHARPGWLVPAILAGLVLVLVLGAYGLGKVFSSSVDEADVAPEEPQGVEFGDPGKPTKKKKDDAATPSPSASQKPAEGAYDGATTAAGLSGAASSCESASSVDAAGNPVSYAAQYALDQDLTTAWRCDGDGAGESLTITLDGETEVGEVGLVPGYAKTDPASGVDRYAENNRLTRVRWTFGDGSSVEQKLDGSPDNRSVQTLRVPVTTSGSVVLEVLASTPGARNTVAVSEVRIGAVDG